MDAPTTASPTDAGMDRPTESRTDARGVASTGPRTTDAGMMDRPRDDAPTDARSARSGERGTEEGRRDESTVRTTAS